MKKILFVINTLGHAGAETALLELLRNLAPDRYEVHLFVLMGQGELVHRLPDHVRLLNDKFDDSSVLSREGKAHLKKQVVRALLSRGCVISQAPYLCRQLWRMLKSKRLQPDKLLWRAMAVGAKRFSEHYDLAVAYLEGGAAYYVADYVEADKKAAFIHVDYVEAGYCRSLDRDCYLKFDRIFPVSDEVKNRFLQVYPECMERTVVFHNLLNQEAIRQRALQSGGFTDRFDGLRILTVGRLTSQKAFEISVEAMKLLKDAGEKVRWYILGEGERRKELENRIQRLGLQQDFLLLGAVENPYPYMAQADLYVHATRFEGKSIAIQEAQTLGCAILVSDCSGNREQIIPNVDGMLCELTPEGICRGVRELIHDEKKRKQFGEAASRKKISDESEIKKLWELIEEPHNS
ncbi:MAG: glycosyltransferase [Candidatus Gastranaerophilales bacterium]|nr:glycosyltransferase [Candidatus Gastranaerophilales bacterium]